MRTRFRVIQTWLAVSFDMLCRYKPPALTTEMSANTNGADTAAPTAVPPPVSSPVSSPVSRYGKSSDFGQVLDFIQAMVSNDTLRKEFDIPHLVVVGRQNMAKTTLINRIIGRYATPARLAKYSMKLGGPRGRRANLIYSQRTKHHGEGVGVNTIRVIEAAQRAKLKD